MTIKEILSVSWGIVITTLFPFILASFILFAIVSGDPPPIAFWINSILIVVLFGMGIYGLSVYLSLIRAYRERDRLDKILQRYNEIEQECAELDRKNLEKEL